MISSVFDHASINFTRNEDFTYDEAGRLTNLLAGYTNVSGSLGFAIDNDFTLDATGNRTSTAVDGGSAVSADIDPNNQLAADGAYSYEYDAEGNLIRRDSNSDNSYTLYTWDHRNRLVKVEHFNDAGTKTRQIDYRYNSDDLRVRRTVSTTFDGGGNPTNGVAEHFVYDGDQVALAVEADGDVDRRYLYAGTDELLVDEVFNEAGTVGQAERGYWALTDHAGTVHELIESDADGTLSTNHNLVQHLDYDASGKIVRAISPTGASIALDTLFTDYAFAGREWDGDAGLYYNRARWYDANTGRFLSEDPIGFEGGDANLYRYGAGDPVNNLDPTGQSWLSSLFKKIGKAFQRSLDFAESVLKNPGDFLDNLDEYAKGIIKDPLNLIGLAIGGPIFASNITWGAFEVGVGLGGIYAGPNWFKALGQGWGALSGGGLGFGAPTL